MEVDGGTTFETHFQYAKALKEGGDLVKFLEDVGENKDPDTHSKSSYVDYYKRVRLHYASGLFIQALTVVVWKQALELCVKLEAIYEEESTKEGGPKSEPTERETEGEAAEDSDEEEDEDDDKVFLEDFAEVKLLQAILHGAIENEQSTSASFAKTLTLFEKALGTNTLSCLDLAQPSLTEVANHSFSLVCVCVRVCELEHC